MSEYRALLARKYALMADHWDAGIEAAAEELWAIPGERPGLLDLLSRSWARRWQRETTLLGIDFQEE